MAEDNSTFEQYWRHSKDLRNWFVAYGIGAIVFITSKDIIPILNGKNISVSPIAMWFLFGAACQILLAYINKLYNYRLYINEITGRTSQSVANQNIGNLAGEFTYQLPGENQQTRPVAGQLTLQITETNSGRTGASGNRQIDLFWLIDFPMDSLTLVLYVIGTYNLFNAFL